MGEARNGCCWPFVRLFGRRQVAEDADESGEVPDAQSSIPFGKKGRFPQEMLRLISAKEWTEDEFNSSVTRFLDDYIDRLYKERKPGSYVKAKKLERFDGRFKSKWEKHKNEYFELKNDGHRELKAADELAILAEAEETELHSFLHEMSVIERHTETELAKSLCHLLTKRINIKLYQQFVDMEKKRKELWERLDKTANWKAAMYKMFCLGVLQMANAGETSLTDHFTFQEVRKLLSEWRKELTNKKLENKKLEKRFKKAARIAEAFIEVLIRIEGNEFEIQTSFIEHLQKILNETDPGAKESIYFDAERSESLAMLITLINHRHRLKEIDSITAAAAVQLTMVVMQAFNGQNHMRTGMLVANFVLLSNGYPPLIFQPGDEWIGLRAKMETIATGTYCDPWPYVLQFYRAMAGKLRQMREFCEADHGGRLELEPETDETNPVDDEAQNDKEGRSDDADVVSSPPSMPNPVAGMASSHNETSSLRTAFSASLSPSARLFSRSKRGQENDEARALWAKRMLEAVQSVCPALVSEVREKRQRRLEHYRSTNVGAIWARAMLEAIDEHLPLVADPSQQQGQSNNASAQLPPANEERAEQSKRAPVWMVQLSGQCKTWRAALPKRLVRPRRTKKNVKDPLFQFFEREINLGAKLLREVRRDLDELLAVCKAQQKQNSHTRELIAALVTSKRVPTEWARYAVPKDVTAQEWMSDFVERVRQLKHLSKSQNLRDEEVWLGGMFFPEAYVTATRQLVAQTNGWSPEQLVMHVKAVGEASPGDSKSTFTLTGLRAIGVVCKSPNSIHLTDEVHSNVAKLQFEWSLEEKQPQSIQVPVYLYADRAKFLFGLDFVPANFDNSLLGQRGVAFVSNSYL